MNHRYTLVALTALLLLGAAQDTARAQQEEQNKSLQGFLGRVYKWRLSGSRLKLIATENKPDFFREARKLGLGISYSWSNGSGSGSSRGGERIYISQSSFNCTSKKRGLRFSVTGGDWLSINLSCPGDKMVVYQQSKNRARLVVFDGDKATVAIGKSFLDLVRRFPKATEAFDTLVSKYLIVLPPHPQRKQVIGLALQAFVPPTKEQVGKWSAQIVLLGDKQFRIREAATLELQSRLRTGEHQLYPFLMQALEKAENPETRARLKGLIKGAKKLKQSYELVVAQQLQRKLPYLIRLLAHHDKRIAKQAAARLVQLTGKQAMDEKAWQKWHTETEARLVWDANQKRYSVEAEKK